MNRVPFKMLCNNRALCSKAQSSEKYIMIRSKKKPKMNLIQTQPIIEGSILRSQRVRAILRLPQTLTIQVDIKLNNRLIITYRKTQIRISVSMQGKWKKIIQTWSYIKETSLNISTTKN